MLQRHPRRPVARATYNPTAALVGALSLWVPEPRHAATAAGSGSSGRLLSATADTAAPATIARPASRAAAASGHTAAAAAAARASISPYATGAATCAAIYAAAAAATGAARRLLASAALVATIPAVVTADRSAAMLPDRDSQEHRLRRGRRVRGEHDSQRRGGARQVHPQG